MQHLEGPFRVYVGLAPMGYLNPGAIAQVVREGMAFCGVSRKLERLNPSSRILIRPDVALADDKVARHAYTHPEITRAAIQETLALAPSAKVTVTERSLDHYPSFRMLQKAHGNSETYRLRGYYELEHQFPGKVRVLPGDEARMCRYQLSKGNVFSDNHKRAVAEAGESELEGLWSNRFSNEVVAAYDFYNAAFAVYCPKIKSDVQSHGFSGALRMGALRSHRGIPGSKGFSIFRDHHVCDMLEVCNPGLVIGDGVIAAVGGNNISERGHELGVVLVANNALAHDWIAAQILNLDPMRITHLKIALERGWGPLSANQIELGGAGQEGLRQLSQKTRFWDLGLIPAQEIKSKFERENPGLQFPLEIVAATPYETAGSHGALLNWIYQTYDSPTKRPSIARWPKASVCVGAVKSYPMNYMVYVIGDRAIEAISQITSSTGRGFNFGHGRRLEFAQLKNGRRHLLIKVAGSPPSATSLTRTFAIGSFGKMTLGLFRLPLWLDRQLFSWLTRWRASRHEPQLPVVMTSRMPHNAWWSLRSSRYSPVERPAPGSELR